MLDKDSEEEDRKSVLQPPEGKKEKEEAFVELDYTADAMVRERSGKNMLHKIFRMIFCEVIDPRALTYLFWLFIVSLAFIYNAVVMFLRATFPYQSEENVWYWLICDYTCDLIYLVDMILVKPRVAFLKQGLFETDIRMTIREYVHKTESKFDLISLAPFDLLYFATGVKSLWRFPRVLKIQTYWEFFDRLDRVARSGYIIRISRTLSYMLYLIHLEACGYYAASEYENFSTKWTFPMNSTNNAYVVSFYLATKTATSIGKFPQPQNTFEYAFMIGYWLSGVFVFALLVGQIRDIFAMASVSKATYRRQMDAAISYMQNFNVPRQVQTKVRMWFTYNWDTQKTLNELSLLDWLPTRLRTDLAIDVHYKTLSKVKMFQDCDKSLLFALVLKLTPAVYLPGDYICRKGDIGQEMYIVMNGTVEVCGDQGQVFVSLGQGSVFGEISLLRIAGGNRRTAHVRSKGFSTLFSLSSVDFESAMSDYPDALRIMKARARMTLQESKQNQKKANESKTEGDDEEDESEDEKELQAEIIIQPRAPTPGLFKAAVAMSKKDSILKRRASSMKYDGLH